MTGVTFHPDPFDPVRLGGVEQFLPQVSILDGLFIGGFPAVALPAFDPFGQAVHDITAVGRQRHTTWLGQCIEPRNRCRHFHAVVGRQRLAARQLPFARTHADDGAPAARPRIALARAVGGDFDLGEFGHSAA